MTMSRNPPDPILLQRKLFEALREAAWVHEKPDQNPNGTRWTGAIMACHSVAQFLYSSGVDPALAASLLELKAGLMDLEQGNTPPIFSLKSEPLKRDRSSHRKFHHAWAAAILELAMKSGEEEILAADRIARSVSKWHALSMQGVTGTTVVNWRKSIKGGSKEERRQFEAICTELEKDPIAMERIHSVLKNGPPGISKS